MGTANTVDVRTFKLSQFIVKNYSLKVKGEVQIDLDRLYYDYLFKKIKLPKGCLRGDLAWFIRYSHKDFKLNVIKNGRLYVL